VDRTNGSDIDMLVMRSWIARQRSPNILDRMAVDRCRCTLRANGWPKVEEGLAKTKTSRSLSSILLWSSRMSEPWSA